MRSHRCPHCDFIYLGDGPPDEGCPACGKTWAAVVLAPPPDTAAAGPADHHVPSVSRRRTGATFLSGLAVGMLLITAAGVISWKRFVSVERFEDYRDLRSRHAQVEAQLSAGIDQLRASTQRAVESEITLAAREDELQTLRDEMQSLAAQQSSQSAALQSAQTRLAELEQALWQERARNGQSFVRNWQLLGPFPLSAAGADDPLAGGPVDLKQPQPGIDGPVRWARHDSDSDRIGLAAFFGRKDQVVCYALCWVHSETARDVNLSIGSDDGICLWINGSKVHENRITRPASPGQDTARASLKPGWNEILARVDNSGSSEWELILEFRTVEDSRPHKVYSTNLPPDRES